MELGKEELKEVLKEVLDERARIDADTHREDHEFIAEMRAQHAARKEWLDKVKKTALGAAVAFLVTKLFLAFYWLGDLVWEGFKAKHGG